MRGWLSTLSASAQMHCTRSTVAQQQTASEQGYQFGLDLKGAAAAAAPAPADAAAAPAGADAAAPAPSGSPADAAQPRSPSRRLRQAVVRRAFPLLRPVQVSMLSP